MDTSRRKHLSHDVMDLATLIKENPWGKATKEEVKKYISGKLSNDLTLLNNESQRVWDKMFGGLVVRAAEIGRSGLIGGGATGIIGQLIPNATTWELMVIGAIAGAAKESPKLVQTFVDLPVDFRQQKRSAISYLANFK
jgi:hypothetical protein